MVARIRSCHVIPHDMGACVDAGLTLVRPPSPPTQGATVRTLYPRSAMDSVYHGIYTDNSCTKGPMGKRGQLSANQSIRITGIRCSSLHNRPTWLLDILRMEPR